MAVLGIVLIIIAGVGMWILWYLKPFLEMMEETMEWVDRMIEEEEEK